MFTSKYVVKSFHRIVSKKLNEDPEVLPSGFQIESQL